MKININKVVKHLGPRALKLLGNQGKVLTLATEAIQKIASEGGLESLGHDALSSINLVIDWATGRYKGIKKKNLVMILVAILYLLSPLDIIPDFILGIGYLDDVAVFMSILKRIHQEIVDYDEWKKFQRHVD